jgi:hypothetical protein
MRDRARIKPLLERLERVWMKCPDQRLGQLLVNGLGEYRFATDLWYLECEQIVSNLEKLFLDTESKLD